MKILSRILVLAHEPYLNGASHSLLTILVGLKENYEFLVLLPDKGPMEEALIANGIKYKIQDVPRCGYFDYLNLRDHIKRSYYYFKNRGYYLKQLAETCRIFNPDLIYTNTSIISLGFDVARKYSIPHVWHIREYGDLDFKISYIPSWNRIADKIKKSKSPVFVSNLVKKHWLKNMPNTNVVHNGFPNNYTVGKKNLSNKNRVVLGIAGNVIEAKGHNVALHILKEVLFHRANVVLYIYGHHDVNSTFFMELLNYMIINHIHDKVFFKGYVVLSELYREIDILLCCSKNEAFGRTIIEAMSYGIPVVAKNAGGPTEIISKNHDGFLFDNVAEAVGIINRLISDSVLHSQIIENAHKTFMNKFTTTVYLNSMNKIFTSSIQSANNN